MNNPPHIQKIEAVMRSSKLAARGFLGDDPRSLTEIIDADAATLDRLGYTPEQLAQRMQQISDLAVPRLGNWINLDPRRRARVSEARGFLICPWPHPGKFIKRVTTVQLINTDRSIQWSDLNIHLIGQHGFFEGRNAPFRIEPCQLVEIIFDR
jgi:hypothetical protein